MVAGHENVPSHSLNPIQSFRPNTSHIWHVKLPTSPTWVLVIFGCFSKLKMLLKETLLCEKPYWSWVYRLTHRLTAGDYCSLWETKNSHTGIKIPPPPNHTLLPVLYLFPQKNSGQRLFSVGWIGLVSYNSTVFHNEIILSLMTDFTDCTFWVLIMLVLTISQFIKCYVLFTFTLLLFIS